MRIPDPPITGDQRLDQWMRETKRILEVEITRLQRQTILPVFTTANLPSAQAPKWVMVSTNGTAIGFPAYADGTNWRYYGTGTAL